VSITTFLSNETLWQNLSARIKAAHHVDAAIAYFGKDGAKLLPLRSGDRLIVDMSPATVRAGGTNPHEVEKLIDRGVQVFTRRCLHAKTLVADNSVISGSANVSNRSQQVLDEAGILTNDRSAVRRAREFIQRLCTEPVRPEYLEKCKQLYRPPPPPKDVPVNGKNGQHRTKHAKLWIVNLREGSVPEPEVERYEQGNAKAEKLVKAEARSKTDSFHWPYKPRMANELEVGDWIIEIIKYKDTTITVSPPGALLFIDSYVRDRKLGKERYVFHLEVPKRGQTMTWAEFRRAAKSLLKPDTLASPRTSPIPDVKVADRLLGLWTPGGRVSRR
jgi:hypothetical protein